MYLFSPASNLDSPLHISEYDRCTHPPPPSSPLRGLNHTRPVLPKTAFLQRKRYITSNHRTLKIHVRHFCSVLALPRNTSNSTDQSSIFKRSCYMKPVRIRNYQMTENFDINHKKRDEPRKVDNRTSLFAFVILLVQTGNICSCKIIFIPALSCNGDILHGA